MQHAIRLSPQPFDTHSAQLLLSSDVMYSTLIYTLKQCGCRYVTHHGTNVASKGECCEVAVNILAVLVQMADVDLNCRMVLGCDELVCICAARHIRLLASSLVTVLHSQALTSEWASGIQSDA